MKGTAILRGQSLPCTELQEGSGKEFTESKPGSAAHDSLFPARLGIFASPGGVRPRRKAQAGQSKHSLKSMELQAGWTIRRSKRRRGSSEPSGFTNTHRCSRPRVRGE